MADTEEVTRAKLKKMFTDPQKLRKGDPGRPEICPVYALHQIYTESHEDIVAPCKSGELGCVDCKMNLADNMNKALIPIRQRRAEIENDEANIWAILKDGSQRARDVASKTMIDVRKAMNLG